MAYIGFAILGSAMYACVYELEGWPHRGSRGWSRHPCSAALEWHTCWIWNHRRMNYYPYIWADVSWDWYTVLGQSQGLIFTKIIPTQVFPHQWHGPWVTYIQPYNLSKPCIILTKPSTMCGIIIIFDLGKTYMSPKYRPIIRGHLQGMYILLTLNMTGRAYMSGIRAIKT